MCLAVTGVVATLGGNAGAITSGSISPTVLSTSGQEFEITYSGKTFGTPDNPTNNLIVEECIADDTKIGFNPNGIDCSPLSRVNFNNVPAAGKITYGGDPANTIAPFVGIDPNNEEWSVCTPSSGVTNYQSGFFRVADTPTDQADDIFIPFACEGTSLPTTTTTFTTLPSTTTTLPTTDTTTTLPTVTTTTVGDATTTTTTPDGTTTTTVGDGTTTTLAGDPGGGGGSGRGGSGRGGAAALARTGLGAWPMVRLALALLFVGTLLKARAGDAGSPPGGRPPRDGGMP